MWCVCVLVACPLLSVTLALAGRLCYWVCCVHQLSVTLALVSRLCHWGVCVCVFVDQYVQYVYRIQILQVMVLN